MAKKKTPIPAFPITPIPPGTREACRDGDTAALLAWSDALEEGSATEQATILRRLPALLEEMAPLAHRWRQAGQPNATFQYDGKNCWWFVGESEMESVQEGGAAAGLIRELMIGWNYYHPAVEWLIRRVAFPLVRLDIVTESGTRRGNFTSYNLRHGNHFEPLPKGVRLEAVWLEDEHLEDAGAAGMG